MWKKHYNFCVSQWLFVSDNLCIHPVAIESDVVEQATETDSHYELCTNDELSDIGELCDILQTVCLSL